MALWILNDTKGAAHKSIVNYLREITAVFKRFRITVYEFDTPDKCENIFKDKQAVLFVPQEIKGDVIEFVKRCNEENVPVISSYAPLDSKGYRCNYILSESSEECVCSVVTYLNQYKKKKIAFFGIKQSNFDISKLKSLFSVHTELNKSDIFAVTESFDKSFEDFFAQRDKYDAIICTNDMTAVWLFEKLIPLDQEYARNTLVIGYMNSILASVYKYTITSCASDRKLIFTQLLNLYKMFSKERNDQVNIDVYLKTNIFVRESTGNLPVPKMAVIQKEYNSFADDFLGNIVLKDTIENETINFLFNLESFLRGLSAIDLEIIRLFLLNLRNDEVAQKMFLSVQTIKSRSAAMFKGLGVTNKREFIDKIYRYIDPQNLEKYIKEMG